MLLVEPPLTPQCDREELARMIFAARNVSCDHIES